VQKYAGASRVVVRLHGEDDALIFDVKDDGQGFDVVTAKQGAGLANMRDRADALGGIVEVTSQPGIGTLIRGTLPANVRVAVAVAV
jgi:signal transduction histidine kinase